MKLMYHNYRLLLLVEYASVVIVCEISLQILKSAQALSDMLQKQSCYEEALVEKNVDSHSLVM